MAGHQTFHGHATTHDRGFAGANRGPTQRTAQAGNDDFPAERNFGPRRCANVAKLKIAEQIVARHELQKREKRLQTATSFSILRDAFGRAVSSVVEHYLDTVGVRGSKPLPRTIFPLSLEDNFPRVWSGEK